MISRLLVANRAEIASRVFRTCRELGIDTVAVHSDADAGLPYVAEADHAVRLPGSTPGETYLRADLLIDAARRAGADAVHPGYGFLSENAGFARAVVDAGLTWVGPAPESIEAMGSKVRAKEIVREAGVPVLEAPDAPTEADLPLLVKASAGGGGRGMRVVRSLAALEDEIAAARSEADSAFGDGTVFVEPYVDSGRHVEVQVVGYDGGVLVLGDRDCSVQRRHQKVVEEAPAPDLPDATRAALHEAGRNAAASIGYRGAGTVELLYDEANDRFFFLEMNTRLQVEHPVTEEVFGVDLVALQLAVAEGSSAEVAALATTQALDPAGHAIEVRLYAEDPGADYRPQSGLLTAFDIPSGAGVRVESGYAAGDEVSTYYDAMLAKVVAHGPDRRTAARKLAGVLSRARIHGVRTNRDLLVRILRSEEFLDRPLSTGFLEDFDLSGSDVDVVGAAHAATVVRARAVADTRSVQGRIPSGWRNVVSQPQRTTWTTGEDELAVDFLPARDGGVGFPSADVEVLGEWTGRLSLRVEKDEATYDVTLSGTPGDPYAVADVDTAAGHVRLELVPRFVDPADVLASGSLVAPMPGTVVAVRAEQGQQVEAGAPVLVLEAMKMQHTVTAPTAGTVTEVAVGVGAQVASGEVLAVVEAQTEGEAAADE
ncbi:acetyl/propionyl-CoA carboxylase subuit alpha [Marmoricola endophyticus]|uniref:Acetyl/propionyl-CoA carboxylase subuit alpha n=1 Tax=Marmoricola endophyticus TaxID=2040280 RepID=A0A917BK57_9ACTN|nr:biotin carboxylase N-terminal domain-containing protein [Marmoricola endophyticus]GGF48824.1 acetyl/propionyl-CoA carboxylase subuit alpha [Marmoricola endophyticus]